ncbi:MAG: hypothetical protein ABUL54_09690 [Dongia sp.]|jgi:hypothetical protein
MEADAEHQPDDRARIAAASAESVFDPLLLLLQVPIMLLGEGQGLARHRRRWRPLLLAGGQQQGQGREGGATTS